MLCALPPSVKSAVAAALLTFLLVQEQAADAATLHPKMVAEEVTESSAPFAPDSASPNTESSTMAIFPGACTTSSPFYFKASAGVGSGMIGVMDGTDIGVSLAFVDAAGAGSGSTVDLSADKEPNFFSALHDDGDDEGNVGIPFSFEVENVDGAEIAVSCDADTAILVVYKDDSDLEPVEVEIARDDSGNGGGRANKEKAKLKTAAATPIKGAAFQNKNKGKGRNKHSNAVDFRDASETEIGIDFDEEDEVVSLGVEMRDGRGYLIQRTIIMETHAPPPTVKTFPIQKAEVNEDGDIEIKFGGGNHIKGKDGSLLFVARLAVTVDGTEDPIDVVDLRAMVSDDADRMLTFHGGWIRKVANDLALTGIDGWDVVLQDAYVLDPENRYQVIARLNSRRAALDLMKGSHHGKIKNHGPTDEEKLVSDDMKEGRAPEHVERYRRERRSLRGLQTVEKKILVHGYCSDANTFPTSQFSNDVKFSDPNANRSHQKFADLINLFANTTEGLDGCGIIAHSQGGAAALHLATYYWSYLDTPAYSGRPIQSVGTPYQGSALAGNIAALGDIFGIGCGYNYDLTESGATAWLSGIPNSRRSKVHYYTTSFTDKWWRYDYCHLASDLLLSDPDDGTTAKAKGQLPGGNNKGHKTGWCHTTGMRDPAQYLDSSRNSNMNSNAQY